MREIRKGSEPRLLTEYRSRGGEYDGSNFTPVKNAIRSSLLTEQGYLCAYCMTRITAETMKVEHWACQSNNPRFQLDYSNLLGCCMGSEGEKFTSQTCDTKKGDKPLKYNPSKQQDQINNIIKYDGQGKIFSTDIEFSAQINTVLNLNKVRLVQNRSYILTSVRQKLSSKTGKRSRTEIRRFLDDYLTLNQDGQLREYCGLVEYYLLSKI